MRFQHIVGSADEEKLSDLERIDRVDGVSAGTLPVLLPEVTPATTTLPASKTQINKAGDVLRKSAVEHRRVSPEYRQALALVRAYRAAHSYPLAHVTAGMRHHAKKAAGGSWLDIGQRLKQLPTITDKLVRMPKTNLARLQYIGGCRATFLDQKTVDAAIASIESRAKPGMAWDIVDIDDYVTEKTRADGYRAKHIIVRKHGLCRSRCSSAWARLSPSTWGWSPLTPSPWCSLRPTCSRQAVVRTRVRDELKRATRSHRSQDVRRAVARC